MIEAGIIGEDEKFELIEGEIVMMPTKGIAHERIKSALIVAIARALPDHLTFGAETTLRLTNTILLEPDIYARHRVREYWVIDANERFTWVHTEPRSGRWSSIVKRGPQDALTTPTLPSFSIRLDEID
jgi:Uma2 family endonuclease